ncbi:MAG: hypothetical protein AAGA91_18010 [Pseudomonadota bacterium]
MKYLITLPALCVALLLAACYQSAYARGERYPVNAALAGFTVATTVDSPLAKAILEGTATTGSPRSPSCSDAQALPDPSEFAIISHAHSPDTAMALLIRCLLQVPDIRYAQTLFRAEVSRQLQGDRSHVNNARRFASGYTVLFVPGWGYQANDNETGADLALPRDRIAALGFETQLVPLLDNGSIEDNARILADTVRRHLPSGKRIILASASSGGPTVAAALSDEGLHKHAQIRAWINICGVLRGSPVVDTFTPWPKSLVLRTIALLEGWEYDNLLSLSQAKSRQRFARFEPPPHLTVVNYIGTPFSGQISAFGRSFYNLMKSSGPNDGLTTILDALAPGYTVLAQGSDHFIMEDPDIGLKTEALLPVILQLIDRDEIHAAFGAGQEASTTTALRSVENPPTRQAARSW